MLSGDLQEVSLAKGHLLGLPVSSPVPVAATADSHLHRRPSNTHREVWFSLLSLGSWCMQDFVCALRSEVSVSTRPLEVMKSNPAGLQSQIP